jgi:hypothetical protein
MSQKPKIDRVSKIVKLDKIENDFAFWQTMSYQSRLDALEEIRQDYIHWKYNADPGLQRVYSIIKQK